MIDRDRASLALACPCSHHQNGFSLSFGRGHLLLSLNLALGQNLSLRFDLLLGYLLGLDGPFIFGREADIGKVNVIDDDVIPLQIISQFGHRPLAGSPPVWEESPRSGRSAPPP